VREPDQPPEAVQELTLEELQVSVDEPPAETFVGDAASVSDGVGGTALPPPPPPQAESVSAIIVNTATVRYP